MEQITSLIKLEWMKYYKNRTMRVLFVAILAFYPTFLYLLYLLNKKMMIDDEPSPFLSYFYTQSTLWEVAGYLNSWVMYFFITFTGVYMITMEYKYKTLRQNLITGLKRHQFFLSKLLSLFLLCIVLSIWFAVSTLIFNIYIHTDESIEFFTYWETWVRNALMCFGYGLLGMLFGLVFKSLGLSIILFFTYAMVVERGLSLLHRYLIDGYSYLYYPVNAVGDLFSFLFLVSFAGIEDDEGVPYKFFLTHEEAYWATGVYVIILIALGFWKIKKGNF